MSSGEHGQRLRGRGSECAALDRLVTGLTTGQSQALVLRGDAGIGKTALLDYLLGRATGCRTTRIGGVESEMELAFAGLHQFCAPMLDRLDRLPAPQRDALGTAFGMQTGAAPDRFLVGLAVLSLLSEVAEEQPLVCVVDDAQWLDQASAQALAFVARRLLAERVALVFAVREPEARAGRAARARVPGLDDTDAQALLTRRPRPARRADAGPDRGRDARQPAGAARAAARTDPAELAGGFGLPGARPLAGRIERSFGRRLAVAPDPDPAAAAGGGGRARR